MHNNIVRAIDAGEVSLLVLLYLSVAFDTVDHGILLEVLQNRFDVQNRALNHTQLLCVESKMSDLVSLMCSVPQGSVIGPQKFVAYTENIVETIEAFMINHYLYTVNGPQKFGAYTEDIVETIEAFMVNHHLYADDTQLQNHMLCEAIQANCRKMEQCVTAIKYWCSSRRLQLNADKTEVIWFSFRANIKKISQMDTNLHLGSTVVEQVTLVQNLGVYMNGELNMRV